MFWSALLLAQGNGFNRELIFNAIELKELTNFGAVLDYKDVRKVS